MSVLAKTDRVDARILRDFADVLARDKDRHKYITPFVDPQRQELAAPMTRRRQLIDMPVAETNRKQAGTRVVRSIKSVLRMLDKQIAALDRDADDYLDRHFLSRFETPRPTDFQLRTWHCGPPSARDFQSPRPLSSPQEVPA
jgi:transposase